VNVNITALSLSDTVISTQETEARADNIIIKDLIIMIKLFWSLAIYFIQFFEFKSMKEVRAWMPTGGMATCENCLGQKCKHGLVSGAAPQFWEWGVQILLWAKRAENFLGCTPTYTILGYSSYKERHTDSLSDSIATISYWSCSCNF